MRLVGRGNLDAFSSDLWLRLCCVRKTCCNVSWVIWKTWKYSGHEKRKVSWKNLSLHEVCKFVIISRYYFTLLLHLLNLGAREEWMIKWQLKISWRSPGTFFHEKTLVLALEKCTSTFESWLLSQHRCMYVSSCMWAKTPSNIVCTCTSFARVPTCLVLFVVA